MASSSKCRSVPVQAGTLKAFQAVHASRLASSSLVNASTLQAMVHLQEAPPRVLEVLFSFAM